MPKQRAGVPSTPPSKRGGKRSAAESAPAAVTPGNEGDAKKVKVDGVVGSEEVRALECAELRKDMRSKRSV